jgi:hypothetical protein
MQFLIDAVMLLQQHGPLLAAIIFFIWKDWTREQQLTKRIDRLQADQKHTLSTLVHETTKALDRSSAVMERLEQIIHRGIP